MQAGLSHWLTDFYFHSSLASREEAEEVIETQHIGCIPLIHLITNGAPDTAVLYHFIDK